MGKNILNKIYLYSNKFHEMIYFVSIEYCQIYCQEQENDLFLALNKIYSKKYHKINYFVSI